MEMHLNNMNSRLVNQSIELLLSMNTPNLNKLLFRYHKVSTLLGLTKLSKKKELHTDMITDLLATLPDIMRVLDITTSKYKVISTRLLFLKVTTF